MSSSTTTINFSSIDYKGENSLSSYALGITPFTFIPDVSDLVLSANNSHRVVWDFGDGTLSKSFTPSKSYKFPGVYDVNLIVYDCNNNAQISTQTRTLEIYDYIPFTFNIQAFGVMISEDGSYIISEDGSYITAEINHISLKCGKIEGPFNFQVSYPPYQPISTIYYSVSGSNSNNFWDIRNGKFSHLENFQTLYQETYNYSLSSNQYVEIDKIVPNASDIYAKISDGSIVLCKSDDEGSQFIGRSGDVNVFIKDDSISPDVYWKFFFDKTNNILPFYKGNTNHLNNLGIQMKTSIIDNTPTKLSITSNGLDGEGYHVKSFNINPIKYYNTKIPFIVKLKDVDNFSVKNFETIQLSAFDISLESVGNAYTETEDGEILLDKYGNYVVGTGTSITLNTNTYSISSLNYTLSAQNSGGSFRGYLYFTDLSSNELLQNVKLKINGTFVSDQLSSYSLSGSSNYFNVYPINYFDIYKKNENFNPEQTLLDLRFQETLFDKNVLFQDFLGGVLGNDNSDHEGIGLKIYEKISNFVQNTQDIDKCEEDHIKSLGQFLGYNDKNEENYIYPEKIKRIINLASMDRSKLLGTANKFNQNLDIRGRTSKDEYGINIGDKIDTFTYIVSAGTPIVALEKFSNTYSLLNTFQPVSAVGSTIYPLSSYTSDFGWPMVLPSDFVFKDFEKYYLFFRYNDQIDGTVVGGVIDFNNSKTTIGSDYTDNDMFGSSGVFTNMFLTTLYKSLSLVH